MKSHDLNPPLRTSLARDERGIALALVLLALVIMGAVVSGSFLAVRLDRNSAVATTYAADAQGAAEAGLAEVYATWDPAVGSVMPVWDGTPATEIGTPLHNVGTSPYRQFADSVRRLNSQLFLVRSFGVRLDAGGNIISKLGVAQLFRTVRPTIGVNAAVTTQDPLSLNGNAFLISGINNVPSQWGAGECPPLDIGNSDDVVGIRSASATGVATADLDNVYGFPVPYVSNDPTITDASFQDYLDYTYTTLGAQPGVKVFDLDTPYNGVGPVIDFSTSPSSCDKTAALNVGEPYRDPPTGGAVSQCYGYFPVVHATADKLVFSAGGGGGPGTNLRGQGTLLVDGNLELNGNFEWDGLIIVKGAIKINGTGNKLTGAVFAQGVDILSAGSISGNVEIKYSSCAVSKAVGGATLAAPLGQHAWLHIY